MNIISRLQGLTLEEFNQHIQEGNIQVRPARLIPFDRAGDEMALTSVFLSALRLVREFRKAIFSELNLSQSGDIHYYTELSFKDRPDSRIDGVIIIFKSGKIQDVAVFEMKNGNNELDPVQLEKYTELCRNLKIEKLVTISNQFTSDINSCPVGIKNLKSFTRYHLSWTYVLTLAHILLFTNDIAIEDQDQVEIMREVLEYLENKKSGVVGFNYMKKGWAELVEQIVAGTTLRLNSPEVEDTVQSWIQEEQDLALFLSRSLGIMVDTRNKKGQGKQKLEEFKRDLIRDHQLEFNFRIKNVVSEIKTTAYFNKRAVELQVSLPVGSGGSRLKLSWLKKQLDYCQKKAPEALDLLKPTICIDVLFKNSGKAERLNFNSFYLLKNEYNDRDIREFKVSLTKDYGRVFAAPGKFIEALESDSLDFYRLLVQHLEKWQEKAPEAKEKPVGYKQVEEENSLEIKDESQPEMKYVEKEELIESPAQMAIEENQDVIEVDNLNKGDIV